MNQKWYFNSWFILLMFLFGAFTSGVTSILAVILFLVKRKYKKEHEKAAAINLVKQNEPEPFADVEPTLAVESHKKQENKKTYIFKVVGVTKKNDTNKGIQSLIRGLVKDELKYLDPYEGLTNKEILEEYYDDRVYEVSGIGGVDEIILEFEPSNKYDKNAIKVIHENAGHVGYVPATDNIEVADIINNHDYTISWEIIGGKYKYVDFDDEDELSNYEEKVLIKKDTYGIRIEITY